MSHEYYLHKDREDRVSFSLPDGWEPAYVVRAEGEGEAAPPVEQMVRDALTRIDDVPLLKGSPALSAKKVAVIVDDLTRPTPTCAILGVLLPFLAERGYVPEHTTVVVALGTHAPLSEAQLEIKLGSSVLSAYKVIQHNAWTDDLVPVEVPEDGRTVKINPVVAAADLKIGISSVLPHPMAGFGGGPKIVFPGVSDFDSIKAHHPKNVLHPQSKLGVTTGNPFQEEIATAARAAGLNLSINCVYDAGSRIAAVTAGSPDKAFARAIELCFKKLGHVFRDRVDVTITSVFPHTHGNQLLKGLMPASMVTKEGGGVLLFSPLAERIPAEFLNSIRRIREASQNNPAQYIHASLQKGLAFLPDKPMDYNMAMTNVFIRPRMRVILVSEDVSEEEAAAMDMEHAASIEEGLARLKKGFPSARVAIFPAGGLIIPVMG